MKFVRNVYAIVFLGIGSGCALPVSLGDASKGITRNGGVSPKGQTGSSPVVSTVGSGNTTGGSAAGGTGQTDTKAVIQKQMCSVSISGIQVRPGYENYPELANRAEASAVKLETSDGCVSQCNNLAIRTEGFTSCNYRCDFGSTSLLTPSAASGVCSGNIARTEGIPAGNASANPSTGTTATIGVCEVKTQFGVFEGKFIGGNNFNSATIPREGCSAACSEYIAKIKLNSAGGGCSYSCNWNSQPLVTAFSDLNVCMTL
ncbi:MAG: hypothetical protein ACO3A4_12750 [Silvanigrellaceae bacterium]